VKSVVTAGRIILAVVNIAKASFFDALAFNPLYDKIHTWYCLRLELLTYVQGIKYFSVEKPVICQDFQRAFLCLLFLYLGLRFKKIAINIALIYSVFPHFQKFFFFMSFFRLKKGYSK
jgi:hypothetical protein